jgi:hypothetical protein
VGAKMVVNKFVNLSRVPFFFVWVVVVGDEPIKEVYHQKKMKMFSHPLSKLINMNHIL